MFRNVSLIARLSLIFFAFTLINVLLFWLATGSNQMRLIAEKASLEMHRTIVGVEQRLNQLTRTNGALQLADSYKDISRAKTILAVFDDKQGKTPAELMGFNIVSGTGGVLAGWPETSKLRELPPEELQNVVKTLRLREFNNEPFFAVPDVLGYTLTVYIPFAQDRGQDLLLRAVFSMQSMKTELARLMRLGASIVVLLLLLQFALGFLLYRVIVRPLIRLRVASEITGRGEFYQLPGYEKRRDEIGTLVSAFNKMSADIRDQKETIRENFEEIRSRNETMQHELMIAQHIQKSIFPRVDFPHANAMEYRPLYAVSGDFYDVYNFADGTTAYLVCDASGHGVPAALLTMMAKSAFSTFANADSSAGKIMAAVNRHMADSLEMTGQYLTAFYFQVGRGVLQYCNATHPEPIIVAADGNVSRLKSNGFYVGMMAETPFEFETGEIAVSKGVKIVIYTDGITEARNPAGEQFGTERLTEVVSRNKQSSAADIRTAILNDLAQFAEATKPDDDLTLLVLEF